MSKLVDAIKDVRTALLTMLMLMGMAAWAADTRYITKQEAVQAEVRQRLSELQDLEIRKGFSGTGKERAMYESLIRLKKSDIESLRTQLED